MQNTLIHLRVGQILSARIADIFGPKEFLVSFDGDLVRVTNNSNRSFCVGDTVSLSVVTVEPIGFRLAEFERSAYRLSVSI